MHTPMQPLAPGEVFPGAFQEAWAASTAGGGTALTTTAAFAILPDNVSSIELIARNFAGGALVAKFNLCPWLSVLKTTDSLATATDYSDAAASATTADVVLSSLGTAADGDYLFIGSHIPFRGVKVDMTAMNGTASVLTVKYWDGSAWTDITATDGTIAGVATFGQDGNVTWTVPTDWAKAALSAGMTGTAMAIPYRDDALYWTRWEVSVALDATTTAATMIAMNRVTTYAEMIATFSRELRAHKGFGGITAVEALTDGGTANLIVNAFSRLGSAGLDL